VISAIITFPVKVVCTNGRGTMSCSVVVVVVGVVMPTVGILVVVVVVDDDGKVDVV